MDVHQVLVQAYEAAMAWSGIPKSRGTMGDQMKRALGSGLLRFTEGYYADGAKKISMWRDARASCGEAAAAVLALHLEGYVGRDDAGFVRERLSLAMTMLFRLTRKR